MAAILRDLRYAGRVLWKNRTASVVGFLTLTLAIGATTAIFTVADATLLRTLPFPEGGRLLQLGRGYPDGVREAVSPPKFLHWRAEGAGPFAAVAAYESLGSGFNLTGAGRPDRLTGSRVSADFFAALGVAPAMGRDFRRDEDVPHGARVVMLSHALWTRRFGARPDIVGRAVTLNAEPYTVIGVMPERFRFPDTADLWTLFQFDPASRERANYFEVLGRLRPGVTIEQTRTAMTLAMASFRRAHPEMVGNNETVGVRPLRERLYGGMRTALYVLLAAVGLVLLIACVNVANLQLAQAGERRHEIALRTALGASSWVIVRQQLVESSLLAMVSGAAGVALAAWGVPALLALSPVDVSQASAIRVDLRVLAAALTLSLVVGLVFGVLPALQAARPHLEEVLRAGGRRTTSGGVSGWLRRLLVAGEVALALMLTIGSFLLVKSLAGLQSRSPGFSVERVLTMKISLPEAKYGRGEALARFDEQVEQRLAALPGVKAAALALSLPLELGPELPFTIEGRYVPGSESGVANADYRAIGPAYFTALQIPLRRGRLFDARDRRGTLPVAIVNEAAARRFWPGASPIGQRIMLGQPYTPELAETGPREIVGVVADVRENGLAEAAPELLYVPVSQQNDAISALIARLIPMAVVLRGEGAPASLAQAAQQAIWSVDPDQPVTGVRLMEEIVTRSLGSQRFNTVLLGSLAGLALLLAAVGLYGVIAHLVTQQQREIGIRMALGATRSGVVALFIRQSLTLALLGVAGGIAGAFGLTRFLRALLTDISATDPWVFVGAPAVLIVVAVAAALWPASRAARVDPARALRAD
jgi:predicted permease